MTEYVKEPHTAIFIGQIKCGKTHLVLDLIEKEHNKHFITLLSYVQRSEKIRKPITPRGGSKMMIKFGF